VAAIFFVFGGAFSGFWLINRRGGLGFTITKSQCASLISPHLRQTRWRFFGGAAIYSSSIIFVDCSARHHGSSVTSAFIFRLLSFVDSRTVPTDDLAADVEPIGTSSGDGCPRSKPIFFSSRRCTPDYMVTHLAKRGGGLPSPLRMRRVSPILFLRCLFFFFLS